MGWPIVQESNDSLNLLHNHTSELSVVITYLTFILMKTRSKVCHNTARDQKHQELVHWDVH